MSIAEFCVKRPVFTTMLVALFVVTGVFSFRDLSVDLLPKADVERFEVTVRGNQSSSLNFGYDANPSVPCSLHGSGTLNEFWEYGRGKGVTFVFRKLGPGVVVLSRAGRGIGDAALAAPGTVTREATGAVQTVIPAPGPTCQSFSLRSPECGKAFKVRSNLRFGWEKGRLTLQHGSMEGLKKNPALECGWAENHVLFFSEFSYAYPFLDKQRMKLPIKRIFESKRNIKLLLSNDFLAPTEGPAGYDPFIEKLGGGTTVTMKRLKH